MANQPYAILSGSRFKLKDELKLDWGKKVYSRPRKNPTKRKFDVTKIIFFDTYGRGDTRDKLLNAIFESKKAGRNLILKDPNQLLNLTYISDVVEGIVKITQTPSKRILRVSSDNFIRVADLLKCVNELTKPEVMLVKIDSDLMEQFPALRFPTPETWLPDTSLSAGIKLMQKTNS
jgi:nucleoside-diphosphate-sugar epimerase